MTAVANAGPGAAMAGQGRVEPIAWPLPTGDAPDAPRDAGVRPAAQA